MSKQSRNARKAAVETRRALSPTIYISTYVFFFHFGWCPRQRLSNLSSKLPYFLQKVLFLFLNEEKKTKITLFSASRVFCHQFPFMCKWAEARGLNSLRPTHMRRWMLFCYKWFSWKHRITEEQSRRCCESTAAEKAGVITSLDCLRSQD